MQPPNDSQVMFDIEMSPSEVIEKRFCCLVETERKIVCLQGGSKSYGE